MRLILQETEKGLDVLKKNDIMSSLTPVLAAEISDDPGSLSTLVDALTQAKINIVYAYSFSPKKTDNAIIIIRVDDEILTKAVESP